jgi:hypothetical protein
MSEPQTLLEFGVTGSKVLKLVDHTQHPLLTKQKKVRGNAAKYMRE